MVWDFQKLNVWLFSGKINFHQSLNEGRWNVWKFVIICFYIRLVTFFSHATNWNIFFTNSSVLTKNNVCATIGQTEAIGKWHLSAYKLKSFVL